MSKKICKVIKKELHQEDPEKYVKLIREARYFCRNCGHVAAKKSHLCKPEKI